MSKVYSNKALPPGTVLREWRLEQVLGVGGFGIVYKGRGIYFDELVAIKEYFPSAISDRKEGDTVVPNDSSAEEVHALGLKKFVEEAKLLWNLSKPTRHPNIVSVRSLFEINGTAYMVMDFEDGVPLSDLIKQRKKFSEAELLELIRPIGEGLDRAHRVGVLHRDIKPPNILISEDNRPVLIDFGSARFDTADATSTKVTFHTPPYAAIEQYVKTYEQGPWTDIYALGVVLYECVTGTKPPEVLERMHGGLGHPLVEGDWPDFSKPFLRAIDAAMTIRPSDRPQSIPQWLELFGDEKAPYGATADADEAPTRFAAYESPEIVPVVPTPTLSSSGAAIVKLTEPPTGAEGFEDSSTEGKPAADKAVADAARKLKGRKTEDKTESAPPELKKRRLTTQQMALAGGAAAVLLGGGAWALWPRGQGVGSADSISASLAPGGADESAALGPVNGAAPADAAALNLSASVPGAPLDLSRIDSLAAALASLAGEARSAGRGGDAGRLMAASAKIRSLAAEAKAAAAQPGQEALVEAKVAQMNAVAKGAAASLAQNVRRDADAKAKDIPASASGGDAAAFRNALGAVRRSAGAASSGSPGQAIAAARQTLAASRQVAALYPKAHAAQLPAKREEFAAIASSAKAVGQQVVDMGRTAKPGLFASGKRRADYRTRQANAAAAQAELARLNDLSAAIGAVTTPAAADSAIKQAKAIQAKLQDLRASSSAAMPGAGDDTAGNKT
jgi:non-specific serine/threonine protein kinase